MTEITRMEYAIANNYQPTMCLAWIGGELCQTWKPSLKSPVADKSSIWVLIPRFEEEQNNE